MVKGYWIPVLHSHLPFVKHPEHDYFLEEHWLFEAITESYIPLLMNMERMVREGIEFRLTVSMTPPLTEMLSEPYLMEQYEQYTDKLIRLASEEQGRLRDNRDFLPLAVFYHERFRKIKAFFRGFLNSNVLNGYRFFSQLGKLEIITSCATHGFLPLLRENQKAVDVQISLAVESHEKYFGSAPGGIWLPECAYYEDLDLALKKYGLKYFFLDSAGLMKGNPVPRYSVYAPVYTMNEIAVFARDPESSGQVWSAEEGYPGDSLYRDFYRDVGYDLELDYIGPYISPDGERVFTGIKYFRVTGSGKDKKPYDPGLASAKTVEHASHFCSERNRQAGVLGDIMDRPPAIVSPYDAELFGHWWFEGPDFLYNVFRSMDRTKDVGVATPSEYLDMFPQNQVINPAPTSWGQNGYYDVWLNSENDWVYRHLHFMAAKIEDLANKHFDETNDFKRRLLNQMARELLLAQSSDWAFLMTTNTAREYSTKRTKEHIANFNRLLDTFLSGRLEKEDLEWMEYKNSIFQDIEFTVYASRKT